MPTEVIHRLEVEGPQTALAAFRNDRSIWEVEPWAGMFAIPKAEGKPADGVLIYHYWSDTKRRPPAVDDIAAAYPALTFTHEYCDEFGEGPCRIRYMSGRQVSLDHVPLETLGWITWSAEE